MNICLLTPRFPFPENGGDVLRINSVARYLKEKGHKLILCSFNDSVINSSDYKAANELYDTIYTVKRNKLLSLFNVLRYMLLQKPMQCGFYASGKFSGVFKSVIKNENPDLYISHLIRMTPYLEKHKLHDKSIIEMTDALSKTYGLSSASKDFSFKKIIYKFEKNLIKKYEQKVIKNFKKVVLVSKADIEYLGNQSSLAFYTNGINCIEKNPSYNDKKICFVGNMRTLQNQDAALTFINKILPEVKKEIPDVQFHIVGAQPPENIQKLVDNKSIFVTGFVDSVEDYIKDSAVLVAPVNIAAGIQNKVLIGMACNIPVVMTSLISKAIPELVSGDNCFIEDDVKKFADICIKLCKDNKLRNKIASAGYKVMKTNYSWDAILNDYEDL